MYSHIQKIELAVTKKNSRLVGQFRTVTRANEIGKWSRIKLDALREMLAAGSCEGVPVKLVRGQIIG